MKYVVKLNPRHESRAPGIAAAAAFIIDVGLPQHEIGLPRLLASG
jgi:hypothetical protein